MQQITMGHVYLNNLKTGSKGSACGITKLVLDLIQLFERQGTRNRMTLVKRRVSRSKRLPAARLHPQRVTSEPRQGAGALATGMGQLNSRHCAMFLYETGYGSKCIGMGGAPDSAIVRADAPLGTYGGRFD